MRIPVTGEMMRMPGLPAVPAGERIDIDDEAASAVRFDIRHLVV